MSQGASRPLLIVARPMLWRLPIVLAHHVLQQRICRSRYSGRMAELHVFQVPLLVAAHRWFSVHALGNRIRSWRMCSCQWYLASVAAWEAC